MSRSLSLHRDVGANGHQGKLVEFEQEALSQTGVLYGYAIRLAADPTLAEDLVQETLCRAWCSWHRYNPGSQIRAWLATILHHAFVNDRRRARREIPGVDVNAADPLRLSPGTRPAGPDACLGDDAIDPEVLRTIEALPRKFREPVVLKHLQGLPLTRIAQITGAPVGTVKSRLFRARKVLRRRLYRYAVAGGYVRARVGRDAGGGHGRATPDTRGAIAGQPAGSVDRWGRGTPPAANAATTEAVHDV